MYKASQAAFIIKERKMGIPVKLDVFDGPLDLLLHLIEKNKIDIFDIPIVEITEQYMDIISQMEKKDMDIMSEFLVMAATLLKIKSRMLLPAKEDENGEETDPREELVERLLEYKTYKYAALGLKDLQAGASRQLFKGKTLPEEIASYKQEVNTGELLSGITLDRLQQVFNDVMRKQIDKIDPVRSKFGQIKKEEISLEERVVYIEDYASSHGRFSFRAMLEDNASKTMVIVTFLGILELMKAGKLEIVQENIFDDILITYNTGGLA